MRKRGQEEEKERKVGKQSEAHKARSAGMMGWAALCLMVDSELEPLSCSLSLLGCKDHLSIGPRNCVCGGGKRVEDSICM